MKGLLALSLACAAATAPTGLVEEEAKARLSPSKDALPAAGEQPDVTRRLRGGAEAKTIGPVSAADILIDSRVGEEEAPQITGPGLRGLKFAQDGGGGGGGLGSGPPTPDPPIPPTPELPVELIRCGPCTDFIIISSIDIEFTTTQSGACYVVWGTFPSLDSGSRITVPGDVSCTKITVPSTSSLIAFNVYGDGTEIVNEGKVDYLWVSSPGQSSAAGAKITNKGTNSEGGPVEIAVFSPSGADISVSTPGKATVKANGGSDIIFKCYGLDVTVTSGEEITCDGPPDFNGCGEPCANVVTISTISTIGFNGFPPIESDTCYVFDGTFPDNSLIVPVTVNCAKLTVPSGSGLNGIAVIGDDAEIVNEGEIETISVSSLTTGTKITNTGIASNGEPVVIGVFSPTGADITVSDPGKATVTAFPGDVTFECYGAPVTVTAGSFAVCPYVRPPDATECPGWECDVENQYCPQGLLGSTDSDYCCVVDEVGSGTWTAGACPPNGQLVRRPPSLFNGCGEPCGDVITLDEIPDFPGPTIEDNKCYVVDGTFPSGDSIYNIFVKDGVNCAKITVPSGSGLSGIHVLGDDIEIVNEGNVEFITVIDPADRTKIANTGTHNRLGYVTINVFSATTEITVDAPGKAKIFVDSSFYDFTFHCYYGDVWAAPWKGTLCGV